ncbi:phosphoribosylanthranilate isomerase [Oecophyllibacter saccharovorans]|nr:phosphoribosylanthranilate isomerase [Oecophyllibacter saccharovorans]
MSPSSPYAHQAARVADIKICGLRRPAEMELCQALKVRWVGLVFHPASPRFLTPGEARCLYEATSPAQADEPERIGLFVKPTLRVIEQVLEHLPLDGLQLYTSLENAQAIRRHFQLPVWLAQGIADKAHLPSGSSADQIDGYVIEARATAQDTRPGGLGRSFDWALTQDWHSPRPWMLAGGLTPENVQTALQLSGARAVDVSSGVEESPGRKSLARMEKFVRNVRAKSCTSAGS